MFIKTSQFFVIVKADKTVRYYDTINVCKVPQKSKKDLSNLVLFVDEKFNIAGLNKNISNINTCKVFKNVLIQSSIHSSVSDNLIIQYPQS